MSAALKLVQTCSNDDLHRVLYPVALSLVDAPSGLSHRERWALSTILVLVALGYSEIRCYLSALTACANRVHTSHISARTMRRALADLEGRGFLRRRTFRAGDMLHIDLMPILAEILAKKKRVEPSGVSDISVHRTACPPPEKDRISPNSDILVFNTNAPGAREEIDKETIDYYENQRRDREKRGKKIERWDPVARSVWYVGGAARNWLRRMASEEIRTGGGLSGVDWSRWRAAWPSMLREEREHIARTVICPALIAAMRGDLPLLEAENEKATEENSPRGRELKPKNRTNDEGPPSDLDERILWQAARRADKRLADLTRWESEAASLEEPLEDSEKIRLRILRSLQRHGSNGGQCGA